jgi:hypothetical protein
MMGKDKLTPQEIEILTMMIERQEYAHQLSPSKLKFRRACFLLRRLINVEYKSLDQTQTLKMCVSPLTYLYQVFSSSSFSRSYDHYKVLNYRQLVEEELGTCKVLSKDQLASLKTFEPESHLNFKEGNMLQIDLEGINLEKFGIKNPNKEIECKKLVFMVQLLEVGKQAVTICSKEYSKNQLLSSEDILRGQQVFATNVVEGVEIKFQIMIVPASDSTSKKSELLRPFGTPVSLYLSEFQLKNNEPQAKTLTLCKQDFKISFKVVQNALTK